MRRMIFTLLMIFLFPIIAFAGWENDEVGTRYRNDDGTYKIGWHQDVDGNWYYLDNATGYMLKNTSTPDGYTVGENGMRKTEQSDIACANYENKVELEATAYKTNSTNDLKNFDRAIPVTIYYNNKYEYAYLSDKKLTIEIKDVVLSNEGVIYVSYSADEENYYHELHVITHYMLDDGTNKDVKGVLGTWGGEAKSEAVMNYHGKKDGAKPISAEVYMYVEDVK